MGTFIPTCQAYYDVTVFVAEVMIIELVKVRS